MKNYKLLLLFLFVNTYLFGQNVKNPNKKPFTIKAGVYYMNNYVYYGRTDSLKIPYLVPSITFTHDKGFFINADLYYLTDYESRGFDFLELNAGYEFDIIKKLSAGIYGTKYFYTGSSNVISGNINSTFGANLKYNLGALEMYMNGYLFLTNGNADISFNPGISRKIEFGKNSQWSIYPSFDLNFSTLNFYEEFSARKALKNLNKAKNANLSTVETITSVTDKRIKLLDYELALPFTYENKRLEVSVYPTLVFPKNSIYTTTQTIRLLPNGTTEIISNVDSTPFSEKNLSTVFYIQLGICFKI